MSAILEPVYAVMQPQPSIRLSVNKASIKRQSAWLWQRKRFNALARGGGKQVWLYLWHDVGGTAVGGFIPLQSLRHPKHPLRKALHRRLALIWIANPPCEIDRADAAVTQDFDFAFERFCPANEIGFEH